MDLFFRKFGKGPPLIILHGLYGSSGNWISAGKALSKYFTVYVPDLRNHGNSPFSNEHSYLLLENDLYGFMKSQHLDKAIILGHSMGGKTAMLFSTNHPEKVQALIVVDISPRSYINSDKPDPQVVNHTNIINSLLSMDLSRIKNREDADRILMHTIKSIRIRQFLLKNLHRNHDGSFSWKINLNAIHENLHQMMDAPDREKLTRMNGVTGFPVLFIMGEKSNYILNEDIPLIKTYFPSAEIVTIPGTDHWLHAEKRELFVKTTVGFLLGK